MKTIYECSQSTGVKWITVIFFLVIVVVTVKFVTRLKSTC